jgi:hypothetical protein
MIKLKKIGKAIWNFVLLIGKVRAKRDIMIQKAISKHRLGS